MRKYVNRRYQDSLAPEHIWLGVSVEDHTGRPASDICAIPRPMSASVDRAPDRRLGDLDLDGIHWVIAGGESGPRAGR